MSGWYFSTTTGRTTGQVKTWATETPPPEHATTHSMFSYAGEVHFAYGDTVAEALSQLKREFPPRRRQRA